jgi:hypothetical protein
MAVPRLLLTQELMRLEQPLCDTGYYALIDKQIRWVEPDRPFTTPTADEPDGREILYAQAWEARHGPANEQLANVSAEIDRLIDLAAQSPEMKSRCIEKAKALGEQQKALEAQTVSLLSEYRCARQDFAQRAEAAKQLAADALHSHGDDKANKLRPLIERIEITFDGDGRHRRQCKLARLEIIPKGALRGVVFDADTCRAVADQYDNNHGPEVDAKRSETMHKRWAAGDFAKRSDTMRRLWAQGRFANRRRPQRHIGGG